MQTDLQEAWLKYVAIEPGIFSFELNLIIEDEDGEQQSFLIQNKNILINQENNEIKVDIAIDDEKIWAIIPTPQPSYILISRACIRRED